MRRGNLSVVAFTAEFGGTYKELASLSYFVQMALIMSLSETYIYIALCMAKLSTDATLNP